MSLDKVFKHQSVEGLNYKLKNPKFYKIKEFDFSRFEKPRPDYLYLIYLLDIILVLKDLIYYLIFIQIKKTPVL